LAVKYQLSEKQSFRLAWGIHGRVLPFGNYFTQIKGHKVNLDVDLIRAQHYVAGWDLLAGKSLCLHADVYFQKIKDVPKVLYNGGQRLTPLLPGQSVNRYSQEPLLDEFNAFTEQVDPYFRPDLRIAYRKNNPKTAWTLALDIQNIIGRKNIGPLSRTYDPDPNVWVYREQSGLVPVLSFQLDL
jgi:hypothetical protein